MKGEQTEEVKLFEAMPISFVQQDVISYNATISGEKSGQWQAMCKSEPHPSVIRHSAATRACEKGERLEEALRLFGTLWKAKPLAISYNAAITACEKGDQLQETRVKSSRNILRRLDIL